MELVDKIKQIHSDITDDDFHSITGTIVLQNDGNGDYIHTWNHPTLSQPTQEQLDAITE